MRRRIATTACVAATALISLSLKLAALCCLNSGVLAQSAVAQRTLSLPLEVPRHDVLDRSGIPLNAPEWRTSVAVFPAASASSEVTDRLVTFLTGRHLEDRKPHVVQADLAKLRWVQGLFGDGYLSMAGIVPVQTKVRYGSNSIAKHVVGYVADSRENQGICGVERVMDEWLRKTNPARVAAHTDASGVPIPWLGFRLLACSDSPGAGVYLTLDYRIQRALEDVLDKSSRPCAGVVVDVGTGDVLAMASRPEFDQNHVAASFSDPRSPFLNRAIQAYTPGSVFKLVTAACVLEESAVAPMEQFHCDGKVQIGDAVVRCSKKDGHGQIDLENAFADSCNVSFIELGRRVGATKLLEYARRLGFGHVTGIGLPDEQLDNLPEAGSMYLGDLANVSIGQGAVTVTPLQVALLTAAIAADGVYREPRLVLRVVNENGKVVFSQEQSRARRVMSQETARALKRAMHLTVQPGHTGAAAWVPYFGCGGKTGSAETGKVNAAGEGVLHSWFTGFAPLESPMYAACIFVEGGGYGGQTAAPMFAQLMRAILGDRPER